MLSIDQLSLALSVSPYNLNLTLNLILHSISLRSLQKSRSKVILSNLGLDPDLSSFVVTVCSVYDFCDSTHYVNECNRYDLVRSLVNYSLLCKLYI